jgi:hypothetical protein
VSVDGERLVAGDQIERRRIGIPAAVKVDERATPCPTPPLRDALHA